MMLKGNKVIINFTSPDAFHKFVELLRKLGGNQRCNERSI